jgi:putative ubiquitin-RnfH superfamily antitoxin RatB of RatAB toxin-antitoxin module
MPATAKFDVELVFALPDSQLLRSIAMEPGTTVADLIAKSDISSAFPEHKIEHLTVGIWGREVGRDRLIKEGDRIEIYRPLELDPREARRQLALSGRTMNNPGGD